MFDNLAVFEQRYEEINEKLYDPKVVSDQNAYAQLMKEHKHLTPIVVQNYSYLHLPQNRAACQRHLTCIHPRIHHHIGSKTTHCILSISRISSFNSKSETTVAQMR